MKHHVVQITIGPGNVIAPVGPLRCEPDDKIVFLVVNLDAVDHYVWIDGGDVFQRQDKNMANPPITNPLRHGKLWKKVNKAGAAGNADVDHFRHHVRAVGDFGKGAAQIPFTSYKYTIKSGTTSESDPAAVVLDPDIDIITP